MTTITNSLVPDATIERAVSQACVRNRKGAFETLTNCGLGLEQTAKIQKILNKYHSDDSVEGREKLKNQIVVALNGEVALYSHSDGSIEGRKRLREYHSDESIEGRKRLKKFHSDGSVEGRKRLREHHSDDSVEGRKRLKSLNVVALNEEVPPQMLEQPTCTTLETKTQVTAQASELFQDLIQTIFSQCFFKEDYESIGALSCVNMHYNRCATVFWNRFDLKQFCPNGLSILDAKAQGIEIDDEPPINSLEIFKAFKKLASFVKDNKGLTLLTMRKGLSYNQLVKIAADQGMDVTSLSTEFPELAELPVEQTYRVLITNSIFIGTQREEGGHFERKSVVEKHGCEVPTIQEYVALCVFTNIFFNKCLLEWDSFVVGCSSTPYQDYVDETFIADIYDIFFAIGNVSPQSLDVTTEYFFGQWLRGCGGRLKY